MTKCIDCNGPCDGLYWCRPCFAKVQSTCGHCGDEMEPDPSGFCSERCESAYGSCDCCGSPRRGGGTCADCREM